MIQPLRQYEILIAATNRIDEVVWSSLWKHVDPSRTTPPCPRAGAGPVRCGQACKEMAETYAHVVATSLRRHGYHVVPAIVPADQPANATA